MKKALLPGMAVFLLLLMPAKGKTGEGDLASMIGYVVELMIPDSRFEYCSASKQPSDWVLSFPLYVDMEIWEISHKVALINMPMLEPQLAVFKDKARGLGGTRFICVLGRDPGFGFFVEGAGLLGQDGSGGMFGCGISYFLYWGLPISITYRHTWTNIENRDDISLGIEVPLPIFRMLFE